MLDLQNPFVYIYGLNVWRKYRKCHVKGPELGKKLGLNTKENNLVISIVYKPIEIEFSFIKFEEILSINYIDHVFISEVWWSSTKCYLQSKFVFY